MNDSVYIFCNILQVFKVAHYTRNEEFGELGFVLQFSSLFEIMRGYHHSSMIDKEAVRLNSQVISCNYRRKRQKIDLKAYQLLKRPCCFV